MGPPVEGRTLKQGLPAGRESRAGGAQQRTRRGSGDSPPGAGSGRDAANGGLERNGSHPDPPGWIPGERQHERHREGGEPGHPAAGDRVEGAETFSPRRARPAGPVSRQAGARLGQPQPGAGRTFGLRGQPEESRRPRHSGRPVLRARSMPARPARRRLPYRGRPASPAASTAGPASSATACVTATPTTGTRNSPANPVRCAGAAQTWTGPRIARLGCKCRVNWGTRASGSPRRTLEPPDGVGPLEPTGFAHRTRRPALNPIDTFFAKQGSAGSNPCGSAKFGRRTPSYPLFLWIKQSGCRRMGAVSGVGREILTPVREQARPLPPRLE